uniref:Uncharacterized protein n=2 Tax=Glycine max TaxID=3847 RepID=A0A0R0IWK3_SOYBN
MNCTRSCCHVECEMAFGILSFRYKKATYSEHSRSIFETNSERKRERERKMADTSGGDAVRPVVICDNKCGCTVPCTGGSTCSVSHACRCTSVGMTTGGGDHVTCSCGEYCGCNPCSCPKTAASGTGCRCGTDCSCASCRT